MPPEEPQILLNFVDGKREQDREALRRAIADALARSTEVAYVQRLELDGIRIRPDEPVEAIAARVVQAALYHIRLHELQNRRIYRGHDYVPSGSNGVCGPACMEMVYAAVTQRHRSEAEFLPGNENGMFPSEIASELRQNGIASARARNLRDEAGLYPSEDPGDAWQAMERLDEYTAGGKYPAILALTGHVVVCDGILTRPEPDGTTTRVAVVRDPVSEWMDEGGLENRLNGKYVLTAEQLCGLGETHRGYKWTGELVTTNP